MRTSKRRSVRPSPARVVVPRILDVAEVELAEKSAHDLIQRLSETDEQKAKLGATLVRALLDSKSPAVWNALRFIQDVLSLSAVLAPVILRLAGHKAVVLPFDEVTQANGMPWSINSDPETRCVRIMVSPPHTPKGLPN